MRGACRVGPASEHQRGDLAPPSPTAAVHGRGAAAVAARGSAFAFADLTSGSGFTPAPDLSPSVTLDDGALLAALEEATADGILRHSGQYDFVFTHDMIREALVEAMSPLRLRRLRERTGEAAPGAL